MAFSRIIDMIRKGNQISFNLDDASLLTVNAINNVVTPVNDELLTMYQLCSEIKNRIVIEYGHEHFYINLFVELHDVTLQNSNNRDIYVMEDTIGAFIKSLKKDRVTIRDISNTDITLFQAEDFIQGITIIRRTVGATCARKIQKLWRKWWYDTFDEHGVTRFCKFSVTHMK